MACAKNLKILGGVFRTKSMFFSFILFYLLVIFWVVKKKASQGDLWEIFPSICWATLMVVPFGLQSSFFSKPSLGYQAWGIIAVGLTLLIADTWPGRRNGDGQGWLTNSTLQGSVVKRAECLHLRLAWLLVLTAIGFQCFHYIKMPQIPLLEVLKGRGWDSVVIMREESSKLLPIHPVIIYLSQWTYSVVTPLVVTLFVLHKRFKIAGLFFLNSVFYAASTLAKFPPVLTVVLTGVFLFSISPLVLRKYLLRGILVAGIAVVSLLAITFTQPLNPISYRASAPRIAEMNANFSRWRQQGVGGGNGKDKGASPDWTLPDHFRELFSGRQYAIVPYWQERLNYYFYRIFLVPAEVSHRWYHFFPVSSSGFVGWQGLRNRGSLAERPPNRVGLWAYFSRFPTQYFPTVSAYASADADAWSRFGSLGLLGLTILLLGLRLGILYLKTQSSVSRALNHGALFILGVNLPMASLPAIIVAQGLLAYLIGLFFLRILERNILHNRASRFNVNFIFPAKILSCLGWRARSDKAGDEKIEPA